MNRFTNEFHTHATEARLSEAERARVRARLADAMNAAPVPSPYLFFARVPMPRLAAAALAILILVGGAGGTVLAAGGALPGDLLYPVKIGVKEPLEGALAVSADAKADWNADVAATRLDEAETLAARGDLTASTSAALAANFSVHATAASEAHARGFSSLITRKSAALLDAGEASGNAESAHASGALVLAISDESFPRPSASAETVSAFAPESSPEPASEKRAVPMMAMMSAPAAEDGSDNSARDDAFLETLSVEAQNALLDASSTVAALVPEDEKSEEASARFEAIAALVVRAEAERAVGSSAEAERDFREALSDAASLDLFLNANGGASSAPGEESGPPIIPPFPI